MDLDNKKVFGEGEGEFIEMTYKLPLPMRLDRWLVSQRPEQSRSSIKNLIDAGMVLVLSLIHI